ncbi:hypothetical protein HPB50_004562 [Hyalomma asiaticum]|uniref:Uncharacterized protein n=1 Tax=Hyalomma asiaticum TaxID=266040 RepID=A0ACB7RMN8_HYAAI|nr:hypothetical protein HPB50_004562 [Hyalomma asiaticum]
MFPLLVLLAVVHCCAAFDVEKTTALGRVGGSRIGVLGRTVEEYRGIPYAKPPLGSLRFRPPEPLQSWDDVVAISPLLSSGVEFSEDCLHLNIWTPVARYQVPVPVLVSIHGGGFSHGSASVDIFNGGILAARSGFVVVSFNYRLGVLGFLDAKSTEAPGNVGLMDQNLALRWIQAHIHHFRGDPSKVTIFGVSAGAMSAHAHVLSPMSRGLFRTACLMSGTFHSPDFVEHVSDSMSKGDVVARRVGCLVGNTTLASSPESVVACLRTKRADDLVHCYNRKFQVQDISVLADVSPTSSCPKIRLRRSKTAPSTQPDLIVGVTTDEGVTALLYPRRHELLAEKIEGLDEAYFNRSIHETIFSWLKNNSSSNLATYTAEARDKAALRRAYVDFLSDRTFVCPKHFTAEGHSEARRTFYQKLERDLTESNTDTTPRYVLRFFSSVYSSVRSQATLVSAVDVQLNQY